MASATDVPAVTDVPEDEPLSLPAPAGYGARRRTPPALRRVTVPVTRGALEWAVRSW